MRKDRKVNIIRSLKHEISFYKRQLLPVNHITIDRTELQHLRLHQVFSREEVMQMPKDVFPDLLKRRLSRAFENAIMQMPIETEFDEYFGVYRATLDLWVKPMRY